MVPPNGNGVSINGNRYPWSIIILCIVLIGNAAVNIYRIEQVEAKIDDHANLFGHHEMDVRMARVEQEIENLEWRINQQVGGKHP
jgi:hypothetical protein